MRIAQQATRTRSITLSATHIIELLTLAGEQIPAGVAYLSSDPEGSGVVLNIIEQVEAETVETKVLRDGVLVPDADAEIRVRS